MQCNLYAVMSSIRSSIAPIGPAEGRQVMCLGGLGWCTSSMPAPDMPHQKQILEIHKKHSGLQATLPQNGRQLSFPRDGSSLLMSGPEWHGRTRCCLQGVRWVRGHRRDVPPGVRPRNARPPSQRSHGSHVRHAVLCEVCTYVRRASLRCMCAAGGERMRGR